MLEINILKELATEQQALILLLMMPVVVTIVGIARYIIGVKSLGIYAPVALTFALYSLGFNGNVSEGSDLLTGVKYGLVLMLIVMVTTLATAKILKSAQMHYFPKVSLILSMVAVALIISIVAGETLLGTNFNAINAFALILIATIGEQFASILFKKNTVSSIWLLIETLSTSIVCYALISWQDFQEFILRYPYLILLTFLINYLIGRYRGLRFREYLRFKDVFEAIEEN